MDISNEIDVKSINSEIIFDIIRYFKIRNEFIYNYLKHEFSKDDLEIIFKSLPSKDTSAFPLLP